jgi:predicted nucleotidyltransferase
MRISLQEIDFLKKELSAILDQPVIYLFGSRLDDDKKGGDLDIMVLAKRKLTWKEKAKVRWRFFEKFGEQKLDIISFALEEKNTFKEIVLRQGEKI